MKQFLLFIFLSCVSLQIIAQTFPISLSTQSIPPHTGNISDWTAPGSNKIAVNIILADANEVNFQARLKVTIEGQGISLTSKNDFNAFPISLRYGAPTQLNGPDLASHLHYENLNFQGFTLQQYEANGGLPDGMYQVCFEAFDFDRIEDQAASLKSCVTVISTLHKTPVILTPIALVEPLYPQFLPVQWQARHNASFPTEYTMEIYDYDQAGGMTPELIIDFDQPFLTKKVMALSSTIVDISDPQLVPGRQYILRVGAEDITNQNGFKNNGWSDFEIFTYGENVCPAPFNIVSENIEANAATIKWDPVPGGLNNSYVVRFKNKAKPNGQWYEDETFSLSSTIENLIENTTYEYQVYTICDGGQAGVFSETATFITGTTSTPVDCGEEWTPEIISNQDPALTINTEDIISIAEFPIYLSEISNTSGAWTGKGALFIPWLASYINVAFNNVKINTNLAIIEGSVLAISDGVHASPNYIDAATLNHELNPPVLDICTGVVPTDFPTNQNTTNAPTATQGQGFTSQNLPFDLVSEDPNNLDALVLDTMVFTPQGASLKAFVALETPTSGANTNHLLFSSSSNFHIGGIQGAPKLLLDRKVETQVQSKTKFSFLQSENSFITWDCKGISEINLAGTVSFCQDRFIPMDTSTGLGDLNGVVNGTFSTSMEKWGDFIATVQVDPFALSSRPNWIWSATEMIFDYSDSSTPETVSFPESYEHADVSNNSLSDNHPNWTGFYIKQAELTLPNSLTGVAPGTTVTADVTDVFIDNFGMSAWLDQQDLFTEEEGRMATWAYSMSNLNLTVKSNQFENLAFDGNVNIPAFEESVTYAAILDANQEYFFTVDWRDTMSIPSMRANMLLDDASTIQVTYDESTGEFTTEAILNGQADFSPQTPAGTLLSLPGIGFETFMLLGEAPYMEVGNWRLGGPVEKRLGSFKLTLNGMGVVRAAESNEVIFGIDATVHLCKESGAEIGGGGIFRLITENRYSDTNREQEWGFKRFTVDKISIDAGGAGYQFRGALDLFEEDNVYGSGFRGAIEAEFPPGLTVAAVAQYGNVNNTEYWFADALAAYEPGISLGTSGLMLYGFGGGASYHMERAGFEETAIPAVGNNPVPSNTVGRSMSGAIYTPNKNVGVGVKAKVVIGTVNPTLFKANATFEMLFNTSGGLHQIAFDGNGKFLEQEDLFDEPKLSCDLFMTYDFPSYSFHADLGVYVNVADMIVGKYDRNKAGQGVMHLSPSDWYMYLGTPSEPMALALKTPYLPKLYPLSISMGGYFDAGTVLPPFPGLPSQVTSILGEYAVTNRDDPRFGQGRGMLFGANIEASLKKLDYGIFYAGFSLGAGWDLMLYDYGANARCAGDENNPNPIGIGGWYGSGQMYAYLQGEVGMRVDIFAYEGNIKILDIGAAAALTARMPNPIYMKGTAGGYFSVLNGLVSGTCKFKFEAGQLCEVVGADVLGVEIISDTSPNLNENQEIDVFIRPEVTFNFPMGQAFEMYDEEGILNLFRAGLLKFELRNTDNDTPVPGEVVWDTNKTVLGFKTTDILDPQTNFEMTVSVNVETKTLFTDWIVLLDDFGDAYFQEKKIQFKTGDAPNFIPLSNIAYSYPIHSQFNYLKGESSEGYVKLIQGQDYLFDGTNSGEWVQKLRMIQNGTIIRQYDFTYNASENTVNYQIPGDQLANSTISQLVLVAIPTTSEAAVDANVVMQETNIVYNQSLDGEEAGADEDFTSILLRQRSLENQAQNLNEEMMLAINFRTSRYNTLAEKVNAMSTFEWSTSELMSGTVAADGTESGLFISGFGMDWNGPEMFDKFEMHGYYNPVGTFIEPLIKLEADLTKTGSNGNKEWYEDVTFEKMSKILPSSTFPVSWRPAEKYGEIPTKAFYLNQKEAFNSRVLTDDEVRNNAATFNASRARLQFKVPFYLALDHNQFKQDVAFHYMNREIPQDMQDFMLWQFQDPYTGRYKFNVNYQKPMGALSLSTDKKIDHN